MRLHTDRASRFDSGVAHFLGAELANNLQIVDHLRETGFAPTLRVLAASQARLETSAAAVAVCEPSPDLEFLGAVEAGYFTGQVSAHGRDDGACARKLRPAW